MNTLIVISGILWILTAVLQKLSIATIGALISTGLFCSRKFGHFCKMSSLLVIEGVSGFITVMWLMLFGNLNWARLLSYVAVRLVFLGVCYYDMTNYTYVKEIHRKE